MGTRFYSSAAWRRVPQHKRRNRMKVAPIVILVAFALASPAVGQQANPADQELMQIRQTMSNQVVEALSRKDAVAWADHYTADVVSVSLCPESPPVVGREALAKRAEGLLKAGVRDYAAKVKEAHLLRDGLAWSTGTATFTINDKDGKPEQARSNRFDVLRRDGRAWGSKSQ